MPIFPRITRDEERRQQNAARHNQPQRSAKLAEAADAKIAAREIILEAKDEALKIKAEVESEAAKIQRESLELQAQLAKREEQQNVKAAQLEDLEKKLEGKLSESQRVRAELLSKLEKIAGITQAEAKEEFLKNLEKSLGSEIARRIKETEESIVADVNKKTQEILVSAMLKGATDYVAEYTVTTIPIPDEEMKGRIIGKEGRNIRALEVSTGVDIDLEEEGLIRLSSFDSVRREIAKVAIERLLKDGRIQPARIEEYVEKAKVDVEEVIYEAGLSLATESGVQNLPQGLISLLGRFKFRTSFGQNQWLHTLEVLKVAVAIAAQLGADVELTRKIALFHDIGKVADEEGPQEEVGAAALRKFGVEDTVVQGVATQHTDNFSSIESGIVFVADAISAARPGARHEPHEEYVKRITEIEKIAEGFTGVDKVFALEAGREIRVIVVPDKITDDEMVKLAHDIAEEVRRRVTVPGQLKVTTIRETRAQATA